MDRLTLSVAAAAAAAGRLQAYTDPLSAALLLALLNGRRLPLAPRPDIVPQLLVHRRPAAVPSVQPVHQLGQTGGDTAPDTTPPPPPPVTGSETDPAPLDLRSPARAPSTASPSSAASSPPPPAAASPPPPPLSVACCDGPVRFQRVPNQHFRCAGPSAGVSRSRKRASPGCHAAAAFPCRTCGARFPSYYFVHKHRKRHHTEQAAAGQHATRHDQ